MAGDVATTDVDTLDGVGDRKTFENWGAVADTVTAVEDKTTGLTSGVQAENGLLLKEYLRGSKFLEKYIGCLNSIIVRVQRRFCE